MTKVIGNYELTEIKAIAACEREEGIVQDAILCHQLNDEFSDGDCIIFGYSISYFETEEEVEDVLKYDTCSTFSEVEGGAYLANE